MRRFFTLLSTTMLLSCSLFLPEARADTVEITQGFVAVPQGSSVITFNFSGSDFSTSGAGSVFGNLVESYEDCSNPGCIEGGLDAVASDSDVSGSATYLGVDHEFSLATGTGIYINLVGGNFEIPEDQQTKSGVLVTAPFTLNGSFFREGFANLVLTGEGSLSLRLSRVQDPMLSGLYEFESIKYRFGGDIPKGVSVQAVPEPATMLLLGTGLVGIGGMIKRRRQR